MERSLTALLDHALACGLAEPCDRAYLKNSLLQLMKLDAVQDVPARHMELQSLLEKLTRDAVRRGVCAKDKQAKEHFRSALLGVLTPSPNWVQERFCSLYAKDPKAATDWYEAFAHNTGAVRTNVLRQEHSCSLCVGNEGAPGAEHRRVVPICVAGAKWYLEGVMCGERQAFLVFPHKHVPVADTRSLLAAMLDLVTAFPHLTAYCGAHPEKAQHGYFYGLPAQCPWEIEPGVPVEGFEQVQADMVQCTVPMLRLRCRESCLLAQAACKAVSDLGTEREIHIFVRPWRQGYETALALCPTGETFPVAEMIV